MSRVLVAAALAALLAACGGDSGTPTAPAQTTTSVTVTVASPVRMGQTTQATGSAALSNGQTQAVTSGWRSDAMSVATVTDAGQVAGIANGRATIYVISGGVQGQQVVRVVPDYQGNWNGTLRVTACSQTGAWADVNFCEGFDVGSLWQYFLRLTQSGETLTATLDYGDDFYDFRPASTQITDDGSASFSASLADTAVDFDFTASVLIRSLRVGELTGTVNEVWRVPGVPGEGRLEQEIVNTSRTGTGLAAGAGRGRLKRPMLGRIDGRR